MDSSFEYIRVRRKIIRTESQCGCELSPPQCGDWATQRRGFGRVRDEYRLEGFQEFFSRIENHYKIKSSPVAVAMEGYNGYAQPLDSLVRERGYRLYGPGGKIFVTDRKPV